MTEVELIEKMADALSWAADFLNARDEMLSALHPDDLPSTSPLTAMANEAMAAWREWQFNDPKKWDVDREPQPTDGPDYHADHTSWVARQRNRIRNTWMP